MIEFRNLVENKEIIEAIAIIGTFISAIVALYTLFEIRKQRYSTYKPELFIGSFCVAPSHNPLLKKGELVMYTVTRFNDYSEKDKVISENYVVPLYKIENLGFGVAKDVECIWNFDFEKGISEIKKKLKKDFEIDFWDGYYTLRNTSNNEYIKGVQVSNYNRIQRVDFISPIHIKEHYNKHSLPEILIFCYYFFVIFKYDLYEKDCKSFYIEDFKDLPKPKLILQYRDLNNKKYKKEISYKITACVSQTDEIIDTSKSFLFFQFEVE